MKNYKKTSRQSTALLKAGIALVVPLSCLPAAALAQSGGGAPEVQNPTTPATTPPAPPTQTGPTLPPDQKAAAEQAAQNDVAPGDIVVTAQRREQVALKTPLSLTALDNSLIEEKQVTGLTDLQFAAPGIRTGQQQGVNRIFIRGIGLSSFAAGADSSVAFYVDGVYVGRPTEQLSSFYDISRIEVLRGPQGALYGRNATGGAINLITNDPSRELGGYVNISLGNYALHEGEGAVNVPLTSNGDLRARVAFKLLDRSGYGHDLSEDHPVNDAHSQAGRVTLQYNPDDRINIKAIGEYTHEADNNNYTSNFGAYQFANPGACPYVLAGSCTLEGIAKFGGFQVLNSQDAATGLPGNTNKREGYAGTLDAKFKLSDRLDIDSITGYRHYERHNASNSDGSSTGIGNTFYNEWSHQFSQELIANYDAGPLQLTGGLSYYQERLRNLVNVPFPELGGVLYIQSGVLDIHAFAAYLQGTYSITDHLRLTAAGRYSTEKRTSVGSFTFGTATLIDDGRRWSAFTPKFGIEYDLVHGTLVYASYTKGFKSGTFNVGQVNPAINPEKVEAYEAGIKSRLLDNKLDITAAYFHYNYKDLQVNKIIGIATTTTNAAAARTDGAELAITARVTPHLSFDGNFTYLKSRFSNFCSVNPLYPTGLDAFAAANPDATPPVYCAPTAPATVATEENLKGKMLPGSPKFAFAVGGQYVQPLGDGPELTFNADVAYQSRVYFSEFNDIQLSQKAVAKVNTSLKFDTGHNWSVTVWGKNIFNKLVSNNKILGIALWGLPIYGAYDPPATFGGTLAFKF